MNKNKSVTIGNLILDNVIFLAPMAGVTDRSFRAVCRELGAGMTYTEMVSAKGMYYNDKKSFDIAFASPDEAPCGVQIFGSEPDIMAEAAELISRAGASLIDINMGCPALKIIKNGEGCALMNNMPLAEKIIKSTISRASIPVTVKFRKGWDENNVNAADFAKMAEQAGASAICVHGRTREQQYFGKADWDIIKKVKDSVNLPVIGNGDILSAEDAEAMANETGCDAVLVARGCLGNPWIFREIRSLFYEGVKIAPRDASEIYGVFSKHFEALAELKGEDKAAREMRKHAAWYIKGLKNSQAVKDTLFKTLGKRAMLETMKDFLDNC